jgi:hypothetical protein
MFCVGTITEWTTLGHKIMVDYDEYEKYARARQVDGTRHHACDRFFPALDSKI